MKETVKDTRKELERQKLSSFFNLTRDFNIFNKGRRMYGYIYRITDLTNGKCYIGQRKWNKPGMDLNYWGSGTIISNIVRKRKKEDRMDTLLREKLMDCATLEELNYFETYFIEHLNTLSPNGYNLNTGGDVRKASDATRSKLRTIRKEKPSPTTFKKGCIPWDKNKKRPEISGEKHPRYVKICPLLLYKYRIVDRLSFSKIGKLFNVDHITIINKCKKYNIYNLLPDLKINIQNWLKI